MKWSVLPYHEKIARSRAARESIQPSPLAEWRLNHEGEAFHLVGRVSLVDCAIPGRFHLGGPTHELPADVSPSLAYLDIAA